MGRGRFLFLGGVDRSVDLKSAELAVDEIRRAVTSASEASGAGGAAPTEVEALRREVFSLRLGLEVLGQMLIEKGVVSEAELARLAAVLFGSAAESDAPGKEDKHGKGKKQKGGKAVVPEKSATPGKLDFETLLAIEAIPKKD